MLMPETAVDENAGLIFRKYDIWVAGISLVVFAIPQAFGVQIFADELLRLRVRALDMLHILASDFF